LDEGTIFTTNPNTTSEVVSFLTTQLPGLTFGITNTTAVNQLLRYYPADPSAGSPYNTGNDTFGRAAQYKRAASVVGDLVFDVSGIYVDKIRAPDLNSTWSGSTKRFPPSRYISQHFYLVIVNKTRYMMPAADMFLIRSYQFAQTGLDAPEFGAGHSFELLFVLQYLPAGTSQNLVDLSVAMIDYWCVRRKA
jgi:hypothetical protein